jgi:hypothetical protein
MAGLEGATDRPGPVAQAAAALDHSRAFGHRGATQMGLLIAYIGTLLVGQSISVGIGLLVDRYHSSYGGLMVFIALYFFMFWAAWRIAVKLTEPKSTA